MKRFIILLLLSTFLSGCTIVSANRTFPEVTWYWSKDAQNQRAEREEYKRQFSAASTNSPAH